ncbi:MAG: D-glycerate dehydrogenase [Anaerolineae bacterium]|nr:D-glycerate dehydrogenase [Anaerolineae bacterium]
MSNKPRVFVTRLIPETGLQQVREHCQAEVWEGELPPPRAILLEKVKGVDGLLCLLTDPIDAQLMEAAGPQLKVISQMAVGFDNVDVEEATRRGIPVGNTPGVLTEATADFAFTLLASAARRVVEAAAYVQAGRWKTWGPMLFLGADLWEATLGIVGFGRIGQAVARRARGFNMRILYHDVTPNEEAAGRLGAQYLPFDDLLRQADFVTLHIPLTPETYHLIGARELRLMKPSAVLVNTSRGPVVDPAALYQALVKGEIAAAALDVTEPEPIPLDSPLLTLPNCLIVPHIASASINSRHKMAEMAAANLLAGLRGERLPNCVNPEVYTR